MCVLYYGAGNVLLRVLPAFIPSFSLSLSLFFLKCLLSYFLVRSLIAKESLFEESKESCLVLS